MEDKLKSKKRVTVIGGGAAGFFCAVNVARMAPQLQVSILEKSNKLLSKVRISGGGRCNVTHACFEISEMIRRYPRGANFVKKAFHQFFTNDTINWFEERGVKLKTESDGRMFPVTDSSQTIIDCLMSEARLWGVSIDTNCTVDAISINNGFRLMTSKGVVESDIVCIASGGYPKSSMFSWITDLGHTIVEPVPSLFTFNMPGNDITRLMGVSVESARVRITGSKLEQEGPLLITHWGISGPAILKLSAWGARELKEKNWNFLISINWLPAMNESEIRSRFNELRIAAASQKVWNRNVFGLPARLWEYLAARSGIMESTRWADLRVKEQNMFITSLNALQCEVRGKTTFKEEFVTSGGIKLNEIDPNNMMSKKVPGLYFAGEILDVDGITGGYNFQHAWTSGFIAAKSIANTP